MHHEIFSTLNTILSKSEITRGVAIVSLQNGVGKTALSHFLALGSSIDDMEMNSFKTNVIHTDNSDLLQIQHRPYLYCDGRTDEAFGEAVQTISRYGGLYVIDCEADHFEFNKSLINYVDLFIIPILYDVDSVRAGMEAYDQLAAAGAKTIRLVANMADTNPKIEYEKAVQYFSKTIHVKNKYLYMGKISSSSEIAGLGYNDNERFINPSEETMRQAQGFYGFIDIYINGARRENSPLERLHKAYSFDKYSKYDIPS